MCARLRLCASQQAEWNISPKKVAGLCARVCVIKSIDMWLSSRLFHPSEENLYMAALDAEITMYSLLRQEVAARQQSKRAAPSNEITCLLETGREMGERGGQAAWRCLPLLDGSSIREQGPFTVLGEFCN